MGVCDSADAEVAIDRRQTTDRRGDYYVLMIDEL
jgi:hypothetical protein